MLEKGKTQKVQVYVIVKVKEKVLLLHRTKDLDVWEFPGGCIEFGEDPRDAAKRELFEETGIKSNKLRLFDVTSVVYPDKKTMQIPIFFFCELDKLPFVRLTEHKEYRWVTFNEAIKLNLALSVKSILEQLKKSTRKNQVVKNKKLLEIIKNDVANLPGFVDLIDRSNRKEIKGWSDLDITLVFNRINYEILLLLRKLWKRWENYGKKIDLFIITEKDSPLLPFHFHGGYQLTYLRELKKARSYFNKYPLTSVKKRSFPYFKLDCFRTMSLKIQEIRRSIVVGRIRFFSKKLPRKAREVMHIFKKCKTIAKMAVQIHGFSGENLEKELSKCFGSNFGKFIKLYNQVRSHWKELSHEENKLEELERVAVQFIEELYEKVIDVIREEYKAYCH